MSADAVWRRFPNWALVLVSLIALVAAGLVGAYIGSPHGQATAVLVPGAPAMVRVARYGAMPSGPTANDPYLPDAVVTVSDTKKVARLAGDANSLPLIPTGDRSCPHSDGSHYQAQFLYSNADRVTLFVERQGCQFIGFDDGSNTAVAWALTDPTFLQDLDALFE